MFGIFRAILGAMGDHEGWQNNQPLTTPIEGVKNLSPDSSIQLSAVWACVDLLARTMGSLPCDVFVIDKDGRRRPDTRCSLHSLLSNSPNKYMTPYEFWQTMTTHWALRGNAYALINRNRDGSAYSIMPLNPDQMNVAIQNGEVIYEYFDQNSKKVTYKATDILHWKCIGNGIIGLSKLEYMRASVNEAMSAQANAVEMFNNKGKINGVLTSEKVINPAQKLEIAKQFNAMRSGGIPVLPVDLKFQQLSLSPADTQLLQTRQFAIEEICRWFGVPSTLVNSNESSDLDAVTSHFYKATILPMCISAEQAIMKRVACSDERTNHLVKFRLSFLNRASDSARYSLYAQAVQNGLMTRNEVRRREDLDDIEGADTLTAQTNLTPLEKLGENNPSQTSQTTLTQDPQKQ